jgi:replication factor A1
MGVVQMVDEISHVTSKKNNEELDKRDLHLVDETGTSIRLTLWGDQARSFTTNGQAHPVMALKGVSVREFQGSLLDTIRTCEKSII